MISRDHWTSISDVATAQSRILPDSKFNPSTDLVNVVVNMSIGNRVLDFGCGIGRNINSLQGAGLEVEGYDLPNMISLCQNITAPLFSDWDLVRNRTYDFIFACLVLQHIEIGHLYQYLHDFKQMSDRIVVFGRVSNDFSDRLVRDLMMESGWTIERIYCAFPIWEDSHEDHEGMLWKKQNHDVYSLGPEC